jgi:pheromone shutdown protein TraB
MKKLLIDYQDKKGNTIYNTMDDFKTIKQAVKEVKHKLANSMSNDIVRAAITNIGSNIYSKPTIVRA